PTGVTLYTTVVVTNANDSGFGSLRDAINQANNAGGALVYINFDIPYTLYYPGNNSNAGPSYAPTPTTLRSALPQITNPVFIDGTTEPLGPNGSGSHMVILDGSQAGSAIGLDITASGSTVQGLAIGNFAGQGIVLEGS